MQTLITPPPLSHNELLNSVAQLNTNELEKFLFQVLTLRAKRIAPNVSKPETELLEQINQGLSTKTQQRYNDLVAKRQAEMLTFEEHKELLALIDNIELADAERAQNLIKLAQLRNVPVKTLMDNLNIHQPSYG